MRLKAHHVSGYGHHVGLESVDESGLRAQQHNQAEHGRAHFERRRDEGGKAEDRKARILMLMNLIGIYFFNFFNI